MLSLTVNGTDHKVDVDPQTPLLWVLRDHLGLTGTKFGCGMALCGACTVHIDGEAVRSCSAPIVTVAGKTIVTIEGLAATAGTEFHPVQEAWIEKDVVQCGFLPLRANHECGGAARESAKADGRRHRCIRLHAADNVDAVEAAAVRRACVPERELARVVLRLRDAERERPVPRPGLDDRQLGVAIRSLRASMVPNPGRCC